MYFGENQLSPRSIGISPLPTAHPRHLQLAWVQTSTGCYPRFILAMGSSRGFGSTTTNLVSLGETRPLQTRSRSGCCPANISPASRSDSPVHSSIGTPADAPRSSDREHRPLTACRPAVSVSLSLPSRGAFHRSLAVLVRYRSHRVFSLGTWASLLPTGLLVTRGTRGRNARWQQASPTGLSPSLAPPSSGFWSPLLF